MSRIKNIIWIKLPFNIFQFLRISSGTTVYHFRPGAIRSIKKSTLVNKAFTDFQPQVFNSFDFLRSSGIAMKISTAVKSPAAL